jgi:hypothetical protein
MYKIKISFSDFWGGYDHNHNFWTIVLNNLKIPYQVVEDDSDILITSCFGSNFFNKKTKKKIYWTGENWFRMDEKHQPINKSILEMFDYVYSFDYNNYSNHFRLPLYLIDTIESNINNYNEILRLKDKDQLYREFQNRGFCTFIQGNGNCEFRNNYFNILNTISKVDSFGSLFNNTGIILSRLEKIEKTKGYKFQLAFENSEYDGYVSEKITDAFKSDIIPIYWGGSKINLEFNDKSFIDVNQLSVENSIKLINDINKNFDLYWEYYNQPIVREDQESVELRIDKFYKNFKDILKN